jgi:alpha-tubulin suppressor-like RCC1 family protein
MLTRARLLFLCVATASAAACGTVVENALDAGTSGGGDGATSAEPLEISTTELPDANREVPYEAQLEATGGTPPYSWSTEGLPEGLSGSSRGEITGTPAEVGSFEVSVAITDGANETATATLSLVVANDVVVLTDSLPAAHVFRPYEVDLEIAGGEPPYTIVQAGLPAGLRLDSAGARIERDPEAPVLTDTQSSTVTLTVTDAEGKNAVATLPLDIIAIDAIGVGDHHSCAIDAEHVTWCWGANNGGRLGIGEEAEGSFPLPHQVAGRHHLTEISGGGSHGCALDDDDLAWCWGANLHGALGIGEEGGNSTTPVQSNHEGPLVELRAGASHTCARDREGEVWCWGINDSGQLGRGEAGTSSGTPEPLAGGLAFEALAVSVMGNHTCALDGEGRAWCWGSNSFGQLGDTSGDDFSAEPVRVSGDTRFSSIATGSLHTCGLDLDDKAWCWGFNRGGEAGQGHDDDQIDRPAPVVDDHTFTAITAGGFHTCALDEDGRAWCWGSSAMIDSGDEARPAQVPGDHVFRAIAAGGSYTCGLDEAGVVWCWGLAEGGGLGDGEGNNSHQPTPVPVVPNL